MELFLVRHAIAMDPGPGMADEARALTAEGRQKFSKVVSGLKSLEIGFDRIYYSPWLRALETAEMLHPLLDGESIASVHLAEPPSKALLNSLAGDRVALVGHQPWLGELLSWLVLGSTEGGSRFRLKKGSVSHLAGEPVPGAMELCAMLPPATLRRIEK